MGSLHPEIAAALKTSSSITASEGGLALKGENFDECTAHLKNILGLLLDKKYVSRERHELYAISENFGDAPLALADRGLMPVLGFQANGIHCNGYVRDLSSLLPSGGVGGGHPTPLSKSGRANPSPLSPPEERGYIKLWIARRSPTSFVEPNKLDHIVAGGQPHGLTLLENLAKEAKEEANIPAALIKKALPVGIIRYAREEGFTIRRDMLFIFDLELPPDFTPQSNDGESHDFRLLDAEEVYRLMRDTDEFKFNVPLVLIDFYIRHGLIEADEPGYAELISGLRQVF